MKKVIVGIGEILWDMLPAGKSLGGAPANFAYHSACLGAEAWAVSAIGDDPLGHEILDVLKTKKLHALLAMSSRPTGIVQVELNADGVPAYNIMENVAWDNIPFTSEMEALAARTDAVCFGSLVQRMNSRDSVRKFIEATPTSALKVFDINLRQHYYCQDVIEASLRMSDILKINDEEIRIVADLLSLDGDDEQVCRKLIDTYSLRLVILTKGAQGSVVVTSDEAFFQPAGKVQVIDTVGAGDSFTAAFVNAYLQGLPITQAQKLASDTAAIVCSHKGAMPKY